MDSEHRHELEQNDLMIWLDRAIKIIQPHLTSIVIVVLAMLAAYFYMGWRKSSLETAKMSAWNDYFAEDYETVYKNFPDSQAAQFARLRSGEKALADARTNLLIKRDAALKDFDVAIEHFEAVASNSKAEDSIRRQAQFLKATAIESRGAPQKAKEEYAKLTTQWRDSAEAKAAERRMKDCDRKSTQDFYKMLVDYKPSEKPVAPSQKSANDLLNGIDKSLFDNMPPDLGSKVNANPPPPPAKEEKIPEPPPLKSPPKSASEKPANEAKKTPEKASEKTTEKSPAPPKK